MNRALENMADPKYRDSLWFAWLQLIRFPNTFTVIADVLAGAILARGTWAPWPLIAGIVVATVAMYWAGMVLNDLYDIDKDRLQNRGRPLVDGRIGVPAARMVGYALLVGGMLAVGMATISYAVLATDIQPKNSMYYATILIAMLLGLAIWLYDGPLKATVMGPVLMGLCRVGSLLIGISIGWWLAPTQPWFGSHLWMAAIGHGMYVMGITWAARREAEVDQTWTLGLGWFICVIGIAMLASVSWFAARERLAPDSPSLAAIDTFVPTLSLSRETKSVSFGSIEQNLAFEQVARKFRLSPDFGYPIAIALLALPWARRAAHSVASPGPGTIQAAVKQAILSIIFFDAILALQFGGQIPALAICSLIVPAMILGRFFRST